MPKPDTVWEILDEGERACCTLSLLEEIALMLRGVLAGDSHERSVAAMAADMERVMREQRLRDICGRSAVDYDEVKPDVT